MDNLIWVIVACGAVNYAIRVIPFLSGEIKTLPRTLKIFLEILPISALGALIFPGVLTMNPEHPEAGLIGLGAAVVVAFFTRNLILPVISAVGIIALYYFAFGVV